MKPAFEVLATDGASRLGRLTLAHGTVLEAWGGNINLNQTGIFTADAGSLRTNGKGTISLRQNNGGSVQKGKIRDTHGTENGVRVARYLQGWRKWGSRAGSQISLR